MRACVRVCVCTELRLRVDGVCRRARLALTAATDSERTAARTALAAMSHAVEQAMTTVRLYLFVGCICFVVGARCCVVVCVRVVSCVRTTSVAVHSSTAKHRSSTHNCDSSTATSCQPYSHHQQQQQQRKQQQQQQQLLLSHRPATVGLLARRGSSGQTCHAPPPLRLEAAFGSLRRAASAAGLATPTRINNKNNNTHTQQNNDNSNAAISCSDGSCGNETVRPSTVASAKTVVSACDSVWYVACMCLL